jgi:hypothetical protein
MIQVQEHQPKMLQNLYLNLFQALLLHVPHNQINYLHVKNQVYIVLKNHRKEKYLKLFFVVDRPKWQIPVMAYNTSNFSISIGWTWICGYVKYFIMSTKMTFFLSTKYS